MRFLFACTFGMLSYLQAGVKESLRLHPPAPMLLPRKARVDVEISGYTIPKGAQVLINEWAIGRTGIWEDAHLFSPERFIGSEIDVKGRHIKLTPFGSGRRIYRITIGSEDVAFDVGIIDQLI
ncbi:drimenol monooxygenase-like [Vicia villosa]|uniref:drimenol monooxygenase-like n=1 Tax=Vicia villosa TaxID=3911 RepID=UPI00273AD809|nr:drimenol monooxygenase-like [Vicia villosa]